MYDFAKWPASLPEPDLRHAQAAVDGELIDAARSLDQLDGDIRPLRLAVERADEVALVGFGAQVLGLVLHGL